ncbi:MAG: CBS domain-containing protein [Gemmatimonadota bacterium]
MRIRHILARKGRYVSTVGAEASVAEALEVMMTHGVGSAVVLSGPRVVGIITERDVLSIVHRDPAGFSRTPVSEAMVSEPILAHPELGLDRVMDLMTENRVRHLPVMEGALLVGLVSIGDVVNELRTEVEAENRFLKAYVQGMVR